MTLIDDLRVVVHERDVSEARAAWLAAAAQGAPRDRVVELHEDYVRLEQAREVQQLERARTGRPVPRRSVRR
jgi:hypothetical protein